MGGMVVELMSSTSIDPPIHGNQPLFPSTHTCVNATHTPLLPKLPRTVVLPALPHVFHPHPQESSVETLPNPPYAPLDTVTPLPQNTHTLPVLIPPHRRVYNLRRQRWIPGKPVPRSNTELTSWHTCRVGFTTVAKEVGIRGGGRGEEQSGRQPTRGFNNVVRMRPDPDSAQWCLFRPRSRVLRQIIK
ncbi:hypothetical protein M427DRAFT_251421 [Gonapodya prolifera JEL478]|uniref:Uncharacterized protein n=1 Tax=Gonapodya prolifera (strain JEL478) TaxID=1344416 RepID=A0A138ZXV0_GONPJ|nr:hypothetical protein M427DRAFT_251421 [Gonapodya prolifera JEL478]|eukprot:KXS09115.1 hypothetical protein M427DRAFT_251421 [Gonapodya prolifera JEL478]